MSLLADADMIIANVPILLVEDTVKRNCWSRTISHTGKQKYYEEDRYQSVLKQLSLGKTKKYPRESIKELIQMKMRCLYFTQSETEQLQMLYNEYGRITTL